MDDAFKKNKQSTFCKALRKYGIDNFDKVIICTYDTEWDALEAEFYCTESGLVGHYNEKPGGGAGVSHTPEVKQKISKANKGKKRTPEQIENHRVSLLNSPKMKAVWEAQIGTPRTEETVESITKAQRARRKREEESGVDRSHSEETKAKIRQGNLGKEVSVETRSKISASWERRIAEGKVNTGKPRTQEEKDKISLSHKKYQFRKRYIKEYNVYGPVPWIDFPEDL
jgi:hypothetical protein